MPERFHSITKPSDFPVMPAEFNSVTKPIPIERTATSGIPISSGQLISAPGQIQLTKEGVK